MKILLILITIAWIVIIYEMWRAPLWKENPDGSYTEIIPPKKFKDLFKIFKNKTRT